VPFTRRTTIETGTRRRQLVQDIAIIFQRLQQAFDAGCIDCALSGIGGACRQQFRAYSDSAALTDGHGTAGGKFDLDARATLRDYFVALENDFANPQPAEVSVCIACKSASGDSDYGSDGLAVGHFFCAPLTAAGYKLDLYAGKSRRGLADA
jgi:hypothetical protein